MDELFGNIELVTEGLTPESKKKIEDLAHVRSNMDSLCCNMLMALVNSDGGGDTGEFEELEKAFVLLGKDLEELRETLFSKKGGSPYGCS